MARTGSPDPPGEIRNEILERQFGVCAGEGCDTKIEQGGIVQHTLPRALGGTDTLSNLEIMCAECNGMKSKTIGFPVHLLNQSSRWLDNQSEVRSFTHLLRLALSDYIASDDTHVDSRTHQKVLREIEELNQKVAHLQSLKKEAEDAVVKLTRAYGYDVNKKSYFHQTMRVKVPEKRHQHLRRYRY